MRQTVTEDDVGKRVETDDGEKIGLVTAVERGTARVDPDPGVMDSIRTALGWESDPDDTVSLADDAISEITDDAVRLEGELSAQGETVGTSDKPDATRSTDHGSDRASDSDQQNRGVDDDTDRDPRTDSSMDVDADELGDTESMHATEELEVTDSAGRSDTSGTEADPSAAGTDRDPNAERRPDEHDREGGDTGGPADDSETPADDPDRQSATDVDSPAAGRDRSDETSK